MIELTIEGVVTVKASCPICGDYEHSQFLVDEHSLKTGNATQRAAFVLERAKESVRARMQAKLWDDERCGRCRIKKAEGGR